MMTGINLLRTDKNLNSFENINECKSVILNELNRRGTNYDMHMYKQTQSL